MKRKFEQEDPTKTHKQAQLCQKAEAEKGASPSFPDVTVHPQTEPSLVEEVPEEVEDLPCDTLVALNVIIAEFPKFSKVESRPFVLRTQLYNSINDRTIVDRELEDLRCKKVVRVFKLATAKDDYAVMLSHDYLHQVDGQRRYMEAKHGAEFLPALDWFLSHVLPNCCDVDITHRKLVELLSSSGEMVKEKHVSFLINAGLLMRKMVDGSAFWFSIPDAGSLLKSLVRGREEIVGLLKKRKYREMLQSELEKRKLRFTELGMRFHLRDMLGSTTLLSIPTNVGPLIRLPKHAAS
eukprot:TRINITY_DN17349_c0_g1_i2.p1 TRINITY_DN17349_c0_g1~~TRINITY_DN17349_c0_g1_i2.p1  ORF type:complete len:294 (-),score=47.37 TRINITY_DN17349_c0_g1_i2:119-1000(-)